MFNYFYSFFRFLDFIANMKKNIITRENILQLQRIDSCCNSFYFTHNMQTLDLFLAEIFFLKYENH